MSETAGGRDGAIQTLADAAAALRRGDVTSAELVERCLRRIERAEPLIHACVTVMAEAARQEAARVDELLRATRAPSPLTGIPMGIKDLIETRGVRTTAGSRVLEAWVPDRDATVVTKLAQAGAVALCKTNTHEFAFGTYTPPTHNPWNPERIPGGSSGGSAAAIATGEVLGALGTDTGGSIRIPAALCGITGLKPTFGLVSRAGIIPLSWTLDTAGPMARTVEDCALILEEIAGYDSADPGSVDVPLLDYRAALAANRSPEDAVRGTRIGIPANYFFEQVDPDVEAVVRAAAATFERLGATLVEVLVPDEIASLYEVYRAVQKPEAFTYHDEMGWLATRAEKYAPAVRANIVSGGEYSAADYIRGRRARRAFSDGMAALLRQVDALLTPAVAIAAPLADESDTPLRAGGRELYGGTLRCTLPFNMSRQPALALPCGFTPSGLPIGLQLAAGAFNEATLLRLGHAYQRVTDWHTRRPPIPGADA